MSDLDALDREWSGTAAAEQGASGFAAIPEGTEVAVVVSDYKGTNVGQNGTPCVKVTFEVMEPETCKNKNIWHDFWLTINNLPYLKRDLETLAWRGKRPSQLMDESDSSLQMCGAWVVTGAPEKYVDKTGKGREKTTINFFKGPYEYKAPQPQGAPANDDDIPF